jgi:hypothetical protein
VQRLHAAAQQQQATGLAAVQNALAVLYSLNRQYDRAVECTRLALDASPEVWLEFWN